MTKKDWQKKSIAIVLALALVLGPAGAFSAFGAGSMGGDAGSTEITIAPSTDLSAGVFWNSSYNDWVTENYIEYAPGGAIRPMVTYGNDIYGAASFSTVVQYAEEADKHVVAILNGDIFNTANGVPIGLSIKDGIVRSSESTANPSVGFRDDGSAIIGSPGLAVALSSDNPAFPGFNSVLFNKAITESSGVMLYSEDFSDSNKAAVPTYNVLMQHYRGEATLGGHAECVVIHGTSATGATPVPDGYMLLSIAEATPYATALTALQSLQPGDLVTVSFNINDRNWADVTHAIGSFGKIVTNGYNTANATDSARHPRTAFGIKADGSLIFYTVDGRQSGYSVGSTLKNLGYRMIELGCVEAVNLDGGGSTTLQAAYPGDSALSQINKPSDSSLRRCGNYIMLVNTARATGATANLHLYPFSPRVLAGSEMRFTIKATDENYYASSVPSHLTYYADPAVGTVSEDGLFKATAGSGSGKVAAASGAISGAAAVTVIDKPESVSVLRGGSAVTALSVTAGDAVDLDGRATYKRETLVSSDSAYTWEVTGNIGSIDPATGVFTATNRGTGTITATAGSHTATVNVTVAGSGGTVEDFEEGQTVFSLLGEGPVTTSLNKDLTKVRYGRQSLMAVYDFALAPTDGTAPTTAEGKPLLQIPSTAKFAKSPGYLNFWVYGDGSGNQIGLSVSTAAGQQQVAAGALDFTGWKQFMLAMPAGTTALNGLNIIGGGAAKGGTLYFDQFVSLTDAYADLIAPTVALSASGQILTGYIIDAGDASPAASNISLTLDGAALPFTLNGSSFTATLPFAVTTTAAAMGAAPVPAPEAELTSDGAITGAVHRVSATVTDQSGNIGRGSLTLLSGDGITAQPFADMDGHWADEYTGYLYSRGVINGMNKEDGLYYQPDNNMNRSEFAVIMANWLVADASAYESVVLPFTDADSIPDWALNQVKAMYSLGYIQGSKVADKGLFFNPASPISREEAMTIIGRSQAKGYGEADLSTYTDSANISSWAAPYLQTLVAQEVISGYNNMLNPQAYVTRGQMAKMVYVLY